jgi:hypothetical protein
VVQGALSGVTRRALGIVALAGVVAGFLDLAFAFIFFGSRGVSPVRILQSVAAGVLGRDAYSGGATTALLGALLHFFIVIVAAAIFYGASRRFPWLVRHAVVAGAVFGLGMFGAMNFIIVPLSASPQKGGSSPPLMTIIIVLVHMFLVGVPIAIGARKASRPARAPTLD